MSLYNYNEFAVLYVDDEVQSTELFKEYFDDTFTIDVANSAEEGWKRFEASPERYGVVITDQRMPGESGVAFLEKVKARNPRVLRILTTAYSDLDAAIQAVNNGSVYKYITKPWDPPSLEITIKRGLEFFLVQRERDQLMREKLAALQRLVMTDRLLSLGIFAAGLNHHLRNSLTAVKMFLDLAPIKLQSEQVDVQALRNPDYWKDFYVTAQKSMERVISLLEEVKSIPEPPKVPLNDAVDLSAELHGALAEVNGAFAAKDIEVKNGSGPGPVFEGNRSMIRRLCLLLLKDESVHVKQGGLVELSCGAGVLPGDRPAVRLTIRDNGPGLRPEMVGCLFDPFFVRNEVPEETGLNLLACFFLVHHHGGSIAVESNAGGGATFDILLPSQSGSLADDPRDEGAFLRRVLENEKIWEKKLIEG
jgi:two-component system probable response regulator PhcQ